MLSPVMQRELREAIKNAGQLLNEKEYLLIMSILIKACERAEKE